MSKICQCIKMVDTIYRIGDLGGKNSKFSNRLVGIKPEIYGVILLEKYKNMNFSEIINAIPTNFELLFQKELPDEFKSIEHNNKDLILLKMDPMDSYININLLEFFGTQEKIIEYWERYDTNLRNKMVHIFFVNDITKEYDSPDTPYLHAWY